ncbi:hypothetical protein BAJUN_00410 [Bajunvirus bajun]|uniref:Uncharacterized protein n=1 Tax=Brevundimonas phage vB_BgoS-Bajun TaxID=2948594 RepID=A0A9E7N7H5_9CAUD|nr:hypothetical protein BAJUN_00410 [Brevundimonas phage vB_BgoS-Bajun]
MFDLDHRADEIADEAFEAAGADGHEVEPTRNYGRVSEVEDLDNGRQRFTLTCDDGKEVDVRKGVAKLSKRLKRWGGEVVIVSEERISKEHPFLRDRDGKLRIIFQTLVTIEAPAVAGTGAKLIGSFELAEDNTSVYRHALNGFTPEELEPFVHRWQDCDHCNLNRARRASFLCETAEGQRVVIGRQCSRDYLGLDSSEILARDAIRKLLSQGDDEEGFFSGGSPYIHVESLVKVAYIAAKRYGGYSRDIRGKIFDDIAALQGARDWDSKVCRKYEEARAWHAANPCEPIDLFALSDYVETATGDFGDNLRIALSCEYAKAKRTAIIVAGVGLYVGRALKRAEDAVVEAARPEPKCLEAAVGQRVDFVATVERTFATQSDFGTTLIITLRGDDGTRCVHFSTGAFKPVKDDRFLVRGTVKRHGANRRDGKPETVITRATYKPATLV